KIWAAAYCRKATASTTRCRASRICGLLTPPSRRALARSIGSSSAPTRQASAAAASPPSGAGAAVGGPSRATGPASGGPARRPDAPTPPRHAAATQARYRRRFGRTLIPGTRNDRRATGTPGSLPSLEISGKPANKLATGARRKNDETGAAGFEAELVGRLSSLTLLVRLESLTYRRAAASLMEWGARMDLKAQAIYDGGGGGLESCPPRRRPRHAMLQAHPGRRRSDALPAAGRFRDRRRRPRGHRPRRLAGQGQRRPAALLR